ncbi:FtsX-like permease family protein [Pseudomaricurvus alkylphenolicus]|uniref:ABC transporter permease n=1 Tax=Pseudomaricurvus alkylphenolicus TaxID=1306991 RepID=UPI00141FCA7C|nr:FtsX-like permease family protein [Pseudomaricurvus alkylphenolicus]NIB44320.1 FtsX-like permease family protein [Pseudomaricurvus alkylphenolicus]
MLELGPILKSLVRKPAAPVLIILQLALSIAIISNAMSYTYQRYDYITRDPGIDLDGLIRIWVKQEHDGGSLNETIATDVEFLLSQNSVESAIAISGVPMSSSGGTSGFSNEPLHEGKRPPTAASSEASVIRLTESGLQTLGARLIQGRDFHPEEYLRFDRMAWPTGGSVIITQALAERLFPGVDNVLGKTVYEGESGAYQVVGVIENMFGHFLNWQFPHNVLIYPHLEMKDSVHYLVRVNEHNEEALMEDLTAKLRNLNSRRIVDNGKTMHAIARNAYAADYAMITLLSVVLAMITVVNALGVLGLTSFWVNQRRRQIGIRRALGATRTAVMRYFLVENTLLVGCSACLGTVVAFYSSAYMVKSYGFEPLPWGYIPVAAMFILLITLTAAFFPVRKASRIPPREAITG